MIPWFSSHICLPVDVEFGPAGADEEDGSLLDGPMVLLPPQDVLLTHLVVHILLTLHTIILSESSITFKK